MTRSHYLVTILACLGLGLGQPCLAQSADSGKDWPFCPARFTIPPRPIVTEKLEPGDIEAEADKAHMVEHGVSHLEGNVEFTRDSQQATADAVDYSDNDNTAVLTGNVNYWDADVYLHGDTAHLDLNEGTGTLNNAEYRLLANRGRGKAKELYLNVGHESRGKRIDFTTCDPEMPGHFLSTGVWKLSASKLTLNYDRKRGYAHNVVIRVKNIPVFYTPYLTFPLTKDRKSGFLTPSMGSTSKSGFELLTPVYWNIAPNLDATLTPRLLTRRGLMGMGEFRYLLGRSRGTISAEYLPSDGLHNNNDRGRIEIKHRQRFASNVRMRLLLDRVTDRQYFQDFGNQLSSTSVRYLQSRADLLYTGPWWRLVGRVQDYQITDPSVTVFNKPYTRLPQVQLRLTPFEGENKINFELKSEVTDFVRYGSGLGLARVNGTRVDVHPSISYPYHTVSGYIEPKLGIRFTQYDLQDPGPYPTSPSRLLPIFSVDSGLEFDRNLSLGSTRYVQTLEPRLYYLYVPHADQSDIPVFDTGIFDQSYVTQFREDRFSGLDRVGDSNKLTLAVESQLFNYDTGRQLGFIRLAQPVLFAHQSVLLQYVLSSTGRIFTSGRPYTHTLGPFVAEAGATFFRNWHVRGELQWDPNDNTTRKAVLWGQYLSGDRVVNIGYRVRRGSTGNLILNARDIEQTDISFRWPVTRQFSVVGRWNYALPERKSLEIFAGVEYESCCWGMRLVARRFLSNLRGSYSTGLFLQLELKGLAGIGEGTESFLAQRIPGYESTF